MEKLKELILSIKVKIFSFFNKMEMPINKESLIDTKLVRHVYKVEKERVKVFYCMIRGWWQMLKNLFKAIHIVLTKITKLGKLIKLK